MAETSDTEKQADIQRVLADVPDKRNRGWSGLRADHPERIAFAGVAAAITYLVAITAIAGLPGLLLSFLVLTVLSFAILIIISMGG